MELREGRYHIVSLIGRGGMSRVYLATDRRLTNRQWAIKEVDRSARDATGRPIELALANEARLLAGIDHPNIVRITDSFTTDEFVYVVMDHVEGQTLAELVRQEGPQRERDVCRWMLQLCDALSYLHRHEPAVVFRDLKPSNVMLRPDGYVKLIDFGAASELRPGGLSEGVSLGTAGYAAPEQYGDGAVDARADVYGLGATMWHLLAGEVPPKDFPLPDVRTRNPKVGEGFAETIIPRCCAMEPSRRYQGVEELAGDLRRYELLTREHREHERARVRSFAFALLASLLCLVVGRSCLGVRALRISQSYEHAMAVAAGLVQDDTAAAEEAYQAAIALRPGDIEPYLGLIECFEVDGSFDVSERDLLNASYQTQLEALAASPRYAELEYELGRLYWYFYSYGVGEEVDSAASGAAADGASAASGAGVSTGLVASGWLDEGNRTARIRASAEHFALAAADESFEKVAKARVYDGIARFTVGIATAMKTDDDDASMYRAYWDDLVSLAVQVADEGGEAIRLDAYGLIANALETYLDTFRRAGVAADEAQSLYGLLEASLGSMATSSEEGEAERLAILGRVRDEVLRKVETVYSDGGSAEFSESDVG